MAAKKKKTSPKKNQPKKPMKKKTIKPVKVKVAVKKSAKKSLAKKRVEKPASSQTKKVLKKSELAKAVAKKPGKSNSQATARISGSKISATQGKAADWNQFLSPLDDRVLVVSLPKVTSSSILILPETESSDPCPGKVVAVGPGNRNRQGQRQRMGVSFGDQVLFQPAQWNLIKLPMGDVYIVREAEIFGILES